MKRFLTTVVILAAACVQAFSQGDVRKAAEDAASAFAGAPDEAAVAVKPKYWTSNLSFNVGAGQTGLTNWAAGGYNTVNLASGLDTKANYKKKNTTWNNRLQMEFGFMYSEDKSGLFQINKDRIYLESKLGFKVSDKSDFSYTASLDFRSQFANGYTYNTPTEGQTWLDAAVLKSGWLAPAYTNIALGIDLVPNNWFNINIAPLTGGLTIAKVESLRKQYGMELLPQYENEQAPEGWMYRSSRFQFGAQVKTNLKFSINEKFIFESQLVLFSDYLNNPQNLRVNWDNKISWQLGKYMQLILSTWLIYDPIILIDNTQKVQFKEFLEIKFAYSLNF